MDEKRGSRNWNLPGVEYALGLVRESVAWLNSRPASPAARISAEISLVAGSEGEWILPGVPTWVANVLTGCSPPEASLKRCSADLLASACPEGDDAWPGLGVNGGGLFGGSGLSAGSGLRLSSPSSVSGSTSMPASIAPTWRATFRLGSGLSSELYGSSSSCITARLRLPLLFAGVRGAFFRSVTCPLCLLELKTQVPKLAQGTEACFPGDDVGAESGAGIALFAKWSPRSATTSDSGSDLPTSAQLMRCVRPVFFVVLPLVVVVAKLVRFAAAADDSGWWPSEFGSSSLLGHSSSERVP